MAFQFSLAAVLRVRGILEEREERMLQKILFEISQSFEALAQIDAEISGTNASRRAEILRPVVGRFLWRSKRTQAKKDRCLRSNRKAGTVA